MLQRAASQAYSWWWASHIRTKQSKWLEQCLQDMEEKVQSMLKLLEEEGESFIQRANMFYKRRPELISNIEESFKAFRALADRYDLLSRELQNANTTIATVFPDQVQYQLSDYEDCPVPPENLPKPIVASNAPKVPKAPNKRLKTIISKASKQLVQKKPPKKPEKSGLTKEEAVEEIKKNQKDILGLQTVKEYVKSSYETGLAKYWGIESQITDLQKRVSKLQDEFDVDMVIEDDDARALMAEAALKSCQETLKTLQEKQENSSREAEEECSRIESASQRLQSLRERYGLPHQEKTDALNMDNDLSVLLREVKGVEVSQGELDLRSVGNLTVTELAEKIDQLVNKVIGLETVVSSQTVLVNTLKTETDDLNDQLRGLEEENGSTIGDTRNKGDWVKEMEGKLNKIQFLNKNVESQNNNLQSNFDEARLNLDCLSGKLCDVKPDEENQETDKETVTTESEDLDRMSELSNVKPDEENPPDHIHGGKEESEDEKDVYLNVDQPETSREEANDNLVVKPEHEAKERDIVREEIHGSHHRRNTAMIGNTDAFEMDRDDGLGWQQLLLTGMEDREKILLKEYTEILRNYKDVKRQLNEKEMNEKESQFDTVLQIRELKEGIERRDREIRNLKHKLEKEVKENNTEQTEEEEDEEEEGVIKLGGDDMAPPMSKVEERIRMDIDAILDENLDFWLRFSTEFHQIGKFKTEVQDLQDEISKIMERRKSEGSFTAQMKSDARPIYKHLREINRELSVWMEESGSLSEELNRRFSSLCILQEEITKALKEGVEGEEIRFSSHQAARFQGELLNMKQENNKVREELSMGLELVQALQRQIDKTLKKVNEQFGLSTEKGDGAARHRVPLKSFIFGTKHEKKQKNSIFGCMHPTKKNQAVRTEIRPSDH